MIIAGIVVFLFGFVEVSVRLFAPQRLETTYIDGESLGLLDSVLGFVNRPNSRALVSGPEFEVEYRINQQGFRDASTYSAVAQAGVTRILLLGGLVYVRREQSL